MDDAQLPAKASGFLRDAWERRFKDPSRRRGYFIAYCLGCIAGYVSYWFTRTSPGFPWGGPGDFTTFYTAALILRSGEGQLLYDLATQARVQQALLLPYGWVFQDGLLPYIYPPFFAFLFIPLTYMPLQAAFHVWNLISLLLLAASVRCLRRAAWPAASRLMAGLAVLAFFPIFEAFYKGQSINLAIFFFSLAYVALKKGHEGKAGFCLAAALFKPQLAVVFVFVMLVKQRWRALRAFAAGGLLLLLASWLLVGLQGIGSYAGLTTRTMTWNGVYNFLPGCMPNLRGTVYRLAEAAGTLSNASSSWMLLATAVLSTLVVAAVLHSWKGAWKTDDAAFDLRFAVTVVAASLVTPYIYGHDLSLLVVAALVAAPALERIAGHRLVEYLVAGGHLALVSAIFLKSEAAAQVTVVALLVALYSLCRHIGSVTDTQISELVRPEQDAGRRDKRNVRGSFS
jgi:hypothetical protein